MKKVFGFPPIPNALKRGLNSIWVVENSKDDSACKKYRGEGKASFLYPAFSKTQCGIMVSVLD